MSDLQTVEEKGKRLGFLIASLDISPEEREALFALLPQMTEKQLEEFSAALEVSYLQAATKKQDQTLAEELKNTDQNFQTTVDRLSSDTIKQLDSIV
ncbi:MAG: hypothetical protein KBC69_00325 [Candidatus Magasanikbacteria bacterium]|nr:hypothetical protein [Candidatus Magasanikbacteria bacterium]